MIMTVTTGWTCPSPPVECLINYFIDHSDVRELLIPLARIWQRNKQWLHSHTCELTIKVKSFLKAQGCVGTCCTYVGYVQILLLTSRRKRPPHLDNSLYELWPLLWKCVPAKKLLNTAFDWEFISSRPLFIMYTTHCKLKKYFCRFEGKSKII